MAKKKSKSKAKPKAKSSVVRPVKSLLSKSALIGRLAEENGLTRKQAAGVFDSLEGALLGSIHPQGAGAFILPGLMKVTLRKVPARKAGTLVRNPGTGEMVKAAARPATVRVKIRPLKKLKTAATK
ncbi:MAG: HU family DNA-binding protein [Alphaproteobacteria bacterium]